MGLWTQDASVTTPMVAKEKKYIYDVFKKIDTDQSLQVTNFAKSIIGISSWADVVSDFEPDALQNTRYQDDAVDDVQTQPDLFQLSHARSPFSLFQPFYFTTSIPLMQAPNRGRQRKFALAFSLFLGIIIADSILHCIMFF